MKKSKLVIQSVIFIIINLAFIFAGSGKLSGNYVIKFDTALDGKFIEKVQYQIKLNSHSEVFVGHYQNIDNDSIFKGKLLNATGKTIIKFTQYDENFFATYSGKMIAPDKFQGTWYDSKGNSGDFILEKSR